MAPLPTSTLARPGLRSIETEPLARQPVSPQVADELPRRLLGRYSYPTNHRVIELVAMLACAVAGSAFAWRTVTELGDRWGIGTALGMAVAALVAFVAADFLSGLVHALCDNLGSVDTHYCITSGITNAPLARLGFWPVLMRSGRWLGRRLPGSPAATGDTGDTGPIGRH